MDNNSSYTNKSVCKNCGEGLNENAKFCSKCGTKVISEESTPKKNKFCSECGAVVQDGVKFCSDCGAKVN